MSSGFQVHGQIWAQEETQLSSGYAEFQFHEWVW